MKAFEILEARLRDRPGLLAKLGPVAKSLVERNVQKGNFAPNSPLTVAIKQGNKPLRDSQRFLTCFTWAVDGETLVIGNTHKAAALLHNGGTVRPTKAKFLAIPTGAHTRTLMGRYGLTPRACIDGMKADGYKIWTSFGGGGSGVVYARKGAKGQLQAIFYLKRSVKIPARPYMHIDEAGKEILTRRLVTELTR